MDIQIKAASKDSAPLLSEVAMRTFNDAFASQNDPRDFQEYLGSAFSVDQMHQELHEPTAQFFVAFDGDRAIGYTKIRAVKCPDCIDDPAPVELQRIYVDQAYIGKKIGAALMQRALDAGRDAGFKTIWLGVWEKNHDSIAFYKKWGYEIVGEHDFVIGTDVQRDHIMMRRI